ncbi:MULTISPECIES: GNAT family N-acetyltransferase [Streptomyces]|uniref:GNAT family N-acetyltransferase n=1 Tax=Streptomyces TaxID=1883 RepID=UPI00163B8744|nr:MULTISPECIES: GNAT family protein [Streptomyces]MBC2875464.1 GNAT family N-acetyltransferase [Streptomyces sp. TYQ1024]UBI35704.1 GNAT family N-acetyltransferase [Streptomyces mobaraensis]UKW28297.1 GNAT family N-acetyltransferase [Streptomyces sp. TYQ1024]
MNPITVTGSRLHLREIRGTDLDALHAVQGHADVAHHMKGRAQTRDEAADAIARAAVHAGAVPRTVYMLGVVRSADGRLIGRADLDLDPFSEKAGTIGFMLHPDTWGAGFGTETVHLLCALGFRHLGLHRIWATRSPSNTASGRTLSKAGLVEEGRIREQFFVDGGWRDSVVHAVLEHEWRAPEGFPAP